ncbi:SMP-30/gluconolactonase/LRE family protein [Streptomyces sp. CA-135486]|uniref:SMP-30/gluconolactonase/LRE family protein n=1 Tax=Streptomyces sp. CA-135486 TaxID=3240049 RepID=UPI003D934109
MRAARESRPNNPPGRALPALRVIPIGAQGPEDVAVDDLGRVYTGVADGRILRLSVLEDRRSPLVEEMANTGGRPLGLELLPDGRLLACDAERGLLRIDLKNGTDAAVEVLVDAVNGSPLRFCSNAAAASDGTVYFTVSSRRFGLQDWLGDILEHQGTGQLLRLRADGGVEVLLDGLQFANGVVLAVDESFVTVAETGAYRLVRLWLSGPRAGERDILVDGLPGFPDNLSRSADGSIIWIALAGPRQAALDLLHRSPPAVRHFAWRLARRLRPQPQDAPRVVGVDMQGRVRHDLGRRRAGYRMVTSVCEHAGRLILGSLHEEAVALCDLPGGPPRVQSL